MEPVRPARRCRRTFRGVEVGGPASREGQGSQGATLPTEILEVPAEPGIQESEREGRPAGHGEDAAHLEAHQHGGGDGGGVEIEAPARARPEVIVRDQHGQNGQQTLRRVEVGEEETDEGGGAHQVSLRFESGDAEFGQDEGHGGPGGADGDRWKERPQCGEQKAGAGEGGDVEGQGPGARGRGSGGATRARGDGVGEEGGSGGDEAGRQWAIVVNREDVVQEHDYRAEGRQGVRLLAEFHGQLADPELQESDRQSHPGEAQILLGYEPKDQGRQHGDGEEGRGGAEGFALGRRTTARPDHSAHRAPPYASQRRRPARARPRPVDCVPSAPGWPARRPGGGSPGPGATSPPGTCGREDDPGEAKYRAGLQIRRPAPSLKRRHSCRRVGRTSARLM